MTSNHKTRGAKMTIESRWGWSDVRNGLPFRPEYERWNRTSQRNYENGRLRAANTLSAYGSVPAQQSKHSYWAAAAKVGYAEPSPKPRW